MPPPFSNGRHPTLTPLRALKHFLLIALGMAVFVPWLLLVLSWVLGGWIKYLLWVGTF